MGAMTPLRPGSYIILELSDPQASDGPVEATLFQPAFRANEEDKFTNLGNSFGSDQISGQPAHFVWMVRAAAAFHKLPVSDDTGRNLLSG